MVIASPIKAENINIEEYQKSCDGGVFDMCNKLGDEYRGKEDYSKAAELYKKSCDGRSYLDMKYGCNALSVLYLNDHYSEGDFSKDRLKAFELLYKACSVQDRERIIRPATPCGNFSDYFTSSYDSIDFFKAAELYEKSCDNRDTIGCRKIALLYEYGKGVKQSTYKAIYFYGKACDMRDSDGCAEYARLNRGRAAFNY